MKKGLPGGRPVDDQLGPLLERPGRKAGPTNLLCLEAGRLRKGLRPVS